MENNIIPSIFTIFSISQNFKKIYNFRQFPSLTVVGNQDQVEKRFGKIDTINKINEYINELNNEDKETLLRREFNPNKRISPNIKRQFINIGYLF